MLTRFPDWQARLDAFFTANARRAFRYGDFDCCLFVAAAVEAMSGVDLARDFRGRYASRAEARARMAEFCGEASVERTAARVAEEHGIERITPARASRGDMLLIRRRREHSLGIVSLTGRDAVIPFARGLMRVDLKHAAAAWRI